MNKEKASGKKFADLVKSAAAIKTSADLIKASASAREENLNAMSQATETLGNSAGSKRLAMLFDDGVFTEIDAFAGSAGGFAEVAAGHGTVDGIGVYAFAQNTDASGGAMSRAQAAKIKKVYDLALKTGEPVVAMYDSIGGRLDEETDLLAAYGDIMRWSNQLSGVVPQISIIIGKCFGTQALIAACGDIVIVTADAEMTIDPSGKDSDPANAVRNGTAHLAAEDEAEAVAMARNLISILPQNNLSPACVAYDTISPQGEVDGDMSAFAAAQAVADEGSFVNLQSAFGQNALTALATVNGTTVGLTALNGVELDGDSCAKSARFIRFCDSFSIPVVTLLDAEKFGCIKGAAQLAGAYAEATCPKVTVITGAAFGAVYIAAAGTGAAADMIYAWSDAMVSALTPEAAAVVMLGDDLGGALKDSKDPKKDKAEFINNFAVTELNAMKAAAAGYVDGIIDPTATRETIISAVEMLCNKRVSTLPKKHCTFI